MTSPRSALLVLLLLVAPLVVGAGCVHTTWVPGRRDARRQCASAVAVSAREAREKLAPLGADQLGSVVIDGRSGAGALERAELVAAEHGGTHVVALGVELEELTRTPPPPSSSDAAAASGERLGWALGTAVAAPRGRWQYAVLHVPRRALCALPDALRCAPSDGEGPLHCPSETR